MDKEQILTLTADIAVAHFSRNTVPVADVGLVIASIYGALSSAVEGDEPEPEYVPAVNPAKSVKRDHIVSLLDGKPYKMLRRHLSTHGLTPDEYRQRFNLRPDYPMVAPAYTEIRRNLAKKIGLGRKPGEKPAGRAAGARS